MERIVGKRIRVMVDLACSGLEVIVSWIVVGVELPEEGGISQMYYGGFNLSCLLFHQNPNGTAGIQDHAHHATIHCHMHDIRPSLVLPGLDLVCLPFCAPGGSTSSCSEGVLIRCRGPQRR